MDDDAIVRELLRRNRRRWPWVLLAIVLLFAAVFGIVRYTLHRRVVVELARIRAEGYPTTLAELDAWYPTPSGANAADVYLEAFDAYVKDETLEALLPEFSADVDWPAPDQPISAEMLEAIEAHLAKNAETLELVAEAVRIPQCRFPIDLNAGVDTLLPHLSELRRFTRLLKLQAILEAQRGQSDRSIESVLAMLAVARSVDKEPILISHLIGISLTHGVSRAVEQILGRASLTDRQLVRLSQAFAGAMGGGTMQRAMIGERAFILGSFGTSMPSRGRAVIGAITGMSDADRSACLRIMGQIIKKSEDLSGYRVDIDAMLQELPWYCIDARTWLPSVAGSFRPEMRTRAMMRILMTALAAKRYQLAHDKLPTRLDELVPEYLDSVPADPFDGKPLRYKLTDTGVVIYSVGRDGADNGGHEYDGKGRRGKDGTDIVFNLRR